MTLPAFRYERPTTRDEALARLREEPEARLLAGGMSLLPLMKMELAAPSVLVDLAGIEDLSGVHETVDAVLVGALTRHHVLAEHPLIRRHVPLLAEAARQIGDPQVRHRGTIGGSLAHADPAADLPGVVLAADAVIEAASLRGTRDIPAGALFLGPLVTALESDEMITQIRFPKQGGRAQHYHKVPHPASGYAVVGVAASLEMAGRMVRSARIALTGVAPHAFRALRAESVVAGGELDPAVIEEASQLVTDGEEVLGDVYASSAYRRHLASLTTRRVLSRFTTQHS